MKRINLRSLLPVAVGAILLAGSVLLAQNPAGPQRVKNACAADIQKFCAGIEHGQGRVYQCLKQNEGSLEANCKAQLDRARARMQDGAMVCQDDILKFCADVQRGQGRIYQCLKANEADLTAACKAHVQRGPGQQRPGK
ncbi:cysteine rich repeat-containing protein [Leptonema illini]|uniref:Cysteine rich repeat-containing protein n=1 Tax=Leptonema illini DSM 21528 TaxID=929563 RepID=H2CLQ2_9LEPT|nr:cysteine rich repeat-containing protein [Leptonema illini]EHQ04663.1 hypothetical protein Lepil_4185 [Leptonema illini DSM 21528]